MFVCLIVSPFILLLKVQGRPLKWSTIHPYREEHEIQCTSMPLNLILVKNYHRLNQT
jgi:hypothetical protein